MPDTPSLKELIVGFIRANSYQIIVSLILGALSAAAIYVTVLSLRKLKVEVFEYYPFDKFFPQSGEWSIFYFLVVVLLLGGLIFILAKGGFYLSPA